MRTDPVESFDSICAVIAERLATECGPSLLSVVEEWTAEAAQAPEDMVALERLDELREVVDAVGFLLGCLGAARGADVLHERRERALSARVLLALREPLCRLRGVSLEVSGNLPRLRPSEATWRPAVLLAMAVWRVRGPVDSGPVDSGTVQSRLVQSAPVTCRCEHTSHGLSLRFDGGVEWDPELLQLGGLESRVDILPDGLLFHACVLEP